MQLSRIIEELSLVNLTDEKYLANHFPEKGYASDMLSCVMSAAKPNGLWVTLQSHLNIVAVAALLELSAVIITEGNIPENQVIEKANMEGIILLTTDKSTFDVVGRLWEMGIRS